MSATTSEAGAVLRRGRGAEAAGKNQRNGSMNMGRGAVLLAALAILLVQTAGCSGPKRVPYRLPNTALVPFDVAGIEDRSAEFGAMFCGVLKHIGLEGGPWGECTEYIENPGPADLDLPVLSNDYRIMVIPGFLGQCLSPGIQAFGDALAHLRDKHGMSAEYFDVPAVGSCEFNARIIASHLQEQTRTDPRKYILVGYSKGACDLMTALVDYPEVREATAALVTVVSPVGGSRLPEQMPEYVIHEVENLSLGHCDKGDGGGVESVRRPVRQAFLRDHPRPVVPTYSVVAVSEEEKTTRLLKDFWRKLSVIARDQDAQVIASEGVPPGATFLGVLKGDHWAIGIPFELSKDSRIRKLFDHNHFPRIALLEAIVRVVVADLQKSGAPQLPAVTLPQP